MTEDSNSLNNRLQSIADELEPFRSQLMSGADISPHTILPTNHRDRLEGELWRCDLISLVYPPDSNESEMYMGRIRALRLTLERMDDHARFQGERDRQAGNAHRECELQQRAGRYETRVEIYTRNPDGSPGELIYSETIPAAPVTRFTIRRYTSDREIQLPLRPFNTESHSCRNCEYLMRGDPPACNALRTPYADLYKTNECPDWEEKTGYKRELDVRQEPQTESQSRAVQRLATQPGQDWIRVDFGRPVRVEGDSEVQTGMVLESVRRQILRGQGLIE